MSNNKQQKPGQVKTGGGAYSTGSINTGGGDFVGRDKNTSISIGGSVSGSNIVVGDGNNVTNSAKTQNLFAPVYHAIEQAALPAQDKDDLKTEVKEIEAEVNKGALADESFLARRLRNLKRMAPEIAEVAFSILAGPGAVVAELVKQVAVKLISEKAG